MSATSGARKLGDVIWMSMSKDSANSRIIACPLSSSERPTSLPTDTESRPQLSADLLLSVHVWSLSSASLKRNIGILEFSIATVMPDTSTKVRCAPCITHRTRAFCKLAAKQHTSLLATPLDLEASILRAPPGPILHGLRIS